MAILEELAREARPIHDEDYGSDRQIAAENRFYEELAHRYPVTFSEDGDGEYAHWALKATTEERIDYAMQLVREGRAK